MLADELAAVVDQLGGAFFFGSLVIPGTCEGNFHCGGRADGTRAEEEGSVTGDNLSVSKCADITDLGFVFLELAGFDHFVELHACGNACQVASLVDGSKRVVVVGKSFSVGLCAGGMAELHIREFLGSLDHEVLMAEGIRKDNAAAGVDKVSRRVIALLAFRNIGADQVVLFGNTELGAGFLCRIDEVEVISGVFIMQSDETDLDAAEGIAGAFTFRTSISCSCRFRRGGTGSRAAASCEDSDSQNQCENNTQCLFHFFLP